MAMNEAKDRVCQLEHAIKRLDCVKKHLNRNASDIKAEIHANVSRNLECLRGREVSLLSQVDTVLGAKEETLQQQQARLNQALGILQTGLSMVLEDKASEKHLAETLKKLDNVELSPEETPYISFRADHVGLRDSILNYGRVDANGLPLITAFDDPGNPSASLPRHLEEYEDVDHHFFYKTLEEVRKSQSSGSCITVTIPKLSTRVEDWLQKKLPAYKTPDAENSLKPNPAIRPSTLPKAGEGSGVGLSRASTPGSSCSLNNWLNIIKQHVDQEEEHDFEIIDHSGPPRVSSRQIPGCHKVDLKLWLAPNSQTAEEYKSNLFGHIPHDKKVWLLQMRQKMTDSSGLPHKDMFSHISKDLSTWLRSRAYAKSVAAEKKGHNFFTHISKDKTVWLMKQKQVDKKGDLTAAKSGNYIKDVDKWLLPRQITTTAEVDKSESKKNTGEPWPLFRTVEEPASPITLEKESRKNPGEIFKPLELPLHDWLASSSKKLISETQKNGAETSPVDLFQHIRNTSSSLWLANTGGAPRGCQDKDCKSESNKNQLPKPQAGKTNSTGLDFCLSDWLLVPAELANQITDHEVEKEKEESEGWSVCSDQTFTSVQYAQDVAVASDYLNKWVL